MLDSILESLKPQIVGKLKETIGLNDSQVDTALTSTKDALEDTVSNEAKSNGMDTLVNLFSKDDNSSTANNLLGDLGSNLLSKLTSNGFDSGMASSIKDAVLPMVVGFVSDKIGGDSGMLGSLLGGGSDGIAGKATDMLKGFFK